MTQSTLRIVVGTVAAVAMVGSVLSYSSRTTVAEPINVLVYETESATASDSPSRRLLEHSSRLAGVDASVFGSGEEFEGFGSKYAAVYPVLKKMSPSTLVVISDGRDVLLNNAASSDKYVASAGAAFREAFDSLTAGHPGAVVVSAEATCCVSALTHAVPGSYFNADGSRKERACASGEDDCLWNGDDKAAPWQKFMHDVAMERTNQKSFDDLYLNAGLMAGTAGDLVNLIERANIGKDEDDQAVLTDFMYRFPEAIVLDYGQTLFGNNRGGLETEEKCMFALEDERLVHTKTMSSPLFVHSPGGFLQCHDDLAIKLGFDDLATTVSRRLKERKKIFGENGIFRRPACNYGKCEGTGLLGRLRRPKNSEEVVEEGEGGDVPDENTQTDY